MLGDFAVFLPKNRAIVLLSFPFSRRVKRCCSERFCKDMAAYAFESALAYPTLAHKEVRV